jgi:hypothetical protein
LAEWAVNGWIQSAKRAHIWTFPQSAPSAKLHCHAIKSLNKIIKTRHKIHLNNNSDNGGSDGGITGRAAGFRRARRRLDCMADNPPDPH